MPTKTLLRFVLYKRVFVIVKTFFVGSGAIEHDNASGMTGETGVKI